MNNRQVLNRRSVLAVPPIAAVALLVAARPAQARARVVECVADLGVE